MIAHIDADAFFASALQRKRPDLKAKPLLALGMGGGCVIAASYEAKACGVKTGMRLSEARKLCPKAIALPSDFDEALLASRQIEDILKNRCLFIERYSVDEWFLDLSSCTGGVPKDLSAWAKEVQQTVQSSVALTVSIGIASSKILAKMASEYRKPAGVTVLTAPTPNPSPDSGEGKFTEDERGGGISIKQFLRDLPASAIPGIGKQRMMHSESNGWKTAWDIANAKKDTVQKLFGRPGLALQRELLGECIEPVSIGSAPPKSISRTRSFPSTRNREMVYAHLLHHLSYTMLKMRRENLACKVVSVWLRSGSYTFDQKEQKLPQPMDTQEQVLPYVHRCFEKLFEAGNDYTQVGLGLYGLNPKGGTQFSLFEDPKRIQQAESIQAAMDELHDRFGRETIKRGAALPVVGSKKKHLNVI